MLFFTPQGTKIALSNILAGFEGGTSRWGKDRGKGRKGGNKEGMGKHPQNKFLVTV